MAKFDELVISRFTDGMLLDEEFTTIITNSSYTPTVSSGILTLYGNDSGYSRVRSYDIGGESHFDLSDSSVFIQVSGVNGSLQGFSNGFFYLERVSGINVGFSGLGSTIEPVIGGIAAGGSVSYEADMLLKIGATSIGGGDYEVYWDYSKNKGGSWATIHSETFSGVSNWFLRINIATEGQFGSVDPAMDSMSISGINSVYYPDSSAANITSLTNISSLTF